MRPVGAGVAAAAALAVALLAGCSTAAPATSASPTPRASFSFPVVPGRVLSDTIANGERHLTVRISDPEAAYADARARLVAAGYSVTKDRVANGGGDGQACTTALCVSFTALDDPDDGPTVTYEAFHSTGLNG